MDLDELRDALNDAGNRTSVDAIAARNAVGVRVDRSRRRRRSASLVALAAVVALVVGTAAIASSHSHKRLDIKPSGSVPEVVPATTTAPTNTTVKTATQATDPLPANAVMLRISGRTISILDARGNDLDTLVTAYAGRTVVNAQLMPDHRTIWYATHADDERSSCPEIVKLDLKTNERTVVAHALDFALTPDRTKLLLVWPYSDSLVRNNCQAVPLPSGAPPYHDGGLVVVDLATGARSILPESENGPLTAGTGGPAGHPWISPSGEQIITSNCVIDGCFTQTLAVPATVGGPIVFTPDRPGPVCGCNVLAEGPDGVYAVDQGSGLGPARHIVRRYEPGDLTGPGTVVAAPNGVTFSSSIAATSAGVFVVGSSSATGTPTLYRVDNGTLHEVGPFPRPTSRFEIAAIPAFERG